MALDNARSARSPAVLPLRRSINAWLLSTRAIVSAKGFRGTPRGHAEAADRHFGGDRKGGPDQRCWSCRGSRALPPRHRHRGDHRHRPQSARTDDVRVRRTRPLTSRHREGALGSLPRSSPPRRRPLHDKASARAGRSRPCPAACSSSEAQAVSGRGQTTAFVQERGADRGPCGIGIPSSGGAGTLGEPRIWPHEFLSERLIQALMEPAGPEHAAEAAR